jgi:hypothetical protein
MTTNTLLSEIYPMWICRGCGKKYGKADILVSSYHMGDRCGWCGRNDVEVTEPRDWGHPALRVVCDHSCDECGVCCHREPHEVVEYSEKDEVPHCLCATHCSVVFADVRCITVDLAAEAKHI